MPSACRDEVPEPVKSKRKKKMKIKPGKGTGTKTVFDADGRQLDPLEALQIDLEVVLRKLLSTCEHGTGAGRNYIHTGSHES